MSCPCTADVGYGRLRSALADAMSVERSDDPFADFEADINRRRAARGDAPLLPGRAFTVETPAERDALARADAQYRAAVAQRERPLTFDETLDRGADRMKRAAAGVGDTVGSLFGRTAGAAHEAATGQKLPGAGDLGKGLSDLLKDLSDKLGKPILIGGAVLAGLFLLSK